MSNTDLRARSASEIVDAAFSLYRRHALQLIVVTAIATAPALIYSLLMSGGAPPTTPADIIKQLPVIAVSIVSYSLVGAVISRMASDIYLGGEPDVATTVRDVLKQLPQILLALVASIMIFVVAFMLMIFPVFWASATLFAIIPCIVIEKKSAFAAMSRSRQLSKGLKKHILGTMALAMGIYLVLSIGLSLGSMALGGQMLQIIVMSVYAIIVGPVVNLTLMILYYDTRIRKEGFDVEFMAQSLNTAPMTVPINGSVA